MAKTPSRDVLASYGPVRPFMGLYLAIPSFELPELFTLSGLVSLFRSVIARIGWFWGVSGFLGIPPGSSMGSSMGSTAYPHRLQPRTLPDYRNPLCLPILPSLIPIFAKLNAEC